MPDSEGISNTLREADIESIEVPGSSAEASPPSAAMRATPQASQPQVQQGQNLAEALEPFMPLANQFVENRSRQIELNHKIEGKRVDLEREAGILAGAVWQRSQQSGTRTVRASGSEEEA